VREVSLTLVTLATSLVIVAAAIHVGYDRTTLVPPAESVTESFARQIATGRFDLAMHFLASETRRRESPHTLAARFASIEPKPGQVDDVQAELQWMRQDHARGRAEVTLRGRTTSFDVQLVRERGRWRIAELPDLVR
jgi:hypothetical protein